MKITDRWGGKVYELGKVKATLIEWATYQKQVAFLGKNQALDVQPDGHLGFVANIQNATTLATEIDANEKTIEQYLWDLRGAQLAVITMRAEIPMNMSGYVRDLMSRTTDEQFKINRIIALQTNPKIVTELNAWADKWIRGYANSAN